MDSKRKIHTYLCQVTLFEANIALRTGLSKPNSNPDLTLNHIKQNILSCSLSQQALNLILIFFNMKTQTPALRKILTSKASVSQEQTVLMCISSLFLFHWNTFNFPITGRSTKVNRLFDFRNAVRQSSRSMTRPNSQRWIKKQISHNPSHMSEKTDPLWGWWS